MVEVVWTKEAEDWLKDIHGYIAQDNPSAALRTVLGSHERVGTLSQFPDIGHVYREEANGLVRVLNYGHYRIAYLRTSTLIYVLGVFHGAMEIERYFR